MCQRVMLSSECQNMHSFIQCILITYLHVVNMLHYRCFCNVGPNYYYFEAIQWQSTFSLALVHLRWSSVKLLMFSMLLLHGIFIVLINMHYSIFFLDKYYRVDLHSKRVDYTYPPYPRSIANYWLGCKEQDLAEK